MQLWRNHDFDPQRFTYNMRAWLLRTDAKLDTHADTQTHAHMHIARGDFLEHAVCSQQDVSASIGPSSVGQNKSRKISVTAVLIMGRVPMCMICGIQFNLIKNGIH